MQLHQQQWSQRGIEGYLGTALICTVWSSKPENFHILLCGLSWEKNPMRRSLLLSFSSLLASYCTAILERQTLETDWNPEARHRMQASSGNNSAYYIQRQIQGAGWCCWSPAMLVMIRGRRPVEQACIQMLLRTGCSLSGQSKRCTCAAELLNTESW